MIPAYQRLAAPRPDRDLHHAVLPSDSAADLRFQHRRVSRIPACRCRQRFRYPQTRASNCRWRAIIERAVRHASGRAVALGRIGFRRGVRIAAETGFHWAATDSGVLAARWAARPASELIYRPYCWQQQNRQIHVIFRDHFLSDLIGFVYSRMDAGGGRRAIFWIASATTAGDPGERPRRPGAHHPRWRKRLGILRSQRPPVPARAVPAHLGRPTDDGGHRKRGAAHAWSRAARPHFPGSWINANFDVWIGAEEDNQAWE